MHFQLMESLFPLCGNEKRLEGRGTRALLCRANGTHFCSWLFFFFVSQRGTHSSISVVYVQPRVVD
jgi:hypothetical protein